MQTRQLVSSMLMLATASAALGGSATINCTTPTNTAAQNVKVTITIGASVTTITVPILPGTTAGQKAKKIGDAIDANAVPNFTVETNEAAATTTIKHLPKDAVVKFDSGKTGEVDDSIKIGALAVGTTNFQGVFQPFDYGGLPAVFTAGIVTDVGELSVQVSAQELNFQTDGPIICQALFQRLAPQAPHYGAQINYAGDRLEVYFDPAYTVTQGGIIFGTSSPTEGSSGQVVVPENPPYLDCNENGNPDWADILFNLVTDDDGDGIPDDCQTAACDPCDVDCNGTVNPFDIQPFLDLLGGVSPPCSPCSGDANGNGTVNPFDINDFLDCLMP